MDIAIEKGPKGFYVGDSPESPIAEITFFQLGQECIVIDHVFVSSDLRGQGIALKLVKRVAEFARQEGKKVIPRCPYARKVMVRGREYQDVLDSSMKDS